MTTEPGRLAGILVITLVWTYTPPNQTSKGKAGNTAHAHCFQSLGNHCCSWVARELGPYYETLQRVPRTICVGRICFRC